MTRDEHLRALNAKASEDRWERSAAYRDMCDALRAVGCASYDELVNQPRAVRDEFHALWTAAMQRRCGLDPLHPMPATTRREERRSKRETMAHRLLETLSDVPGARPAEVAATLNLEVKAVDWMLRWLWREGRVTRTKVVNPDAGQPNQRWAVYAYAPPKRRAA